MLRRIIIYFGLFLLAGCSKVEEASDLISGLSIKEKYQKENNISDELFSIWESRVEKALKDSLEIELPYTEYGKLFPRNFSIYSYNTYLIPGEVIQVKINSDSLSHLIFTELYKRNPESRSFEKITSGDPGSQELQFEIQQSGLYKIVIQPEIEAHTSFEIQIHKTPTYIFPVAGGKNADIGSYWGDIRDGGSRNHEGVDIFAERGTPVLAVTSGRIRYSGEKGLGGKQVWLRDTKRKQSLYYAHLDSIIPELNKVKTGDTLGFVGNTGNARTTPPHLHFGIYKRSLGALDPIGFIYETEEIENSTVKNTIPLKHIIVQTGTANFRNKASSSNSEILKKGKAGERLYVQGKTSDWYHVRDSLDRSMYIHESQVRQAD